MNLFRLFIVVIFQTSILHALASPLSIQSEHPPIVKVPEERWATVSYVVTNQTKNTNTFTLLPIEGITQTVDEGFCSNPFTLKPQQSCVLSLYIAGDEIPSCGINTQVTVCKTKSASDNSPDPLICARTSNHDRLRVNLDMEALAGNGLGKFLILSDIHLNLYGPNASYPNTSGDPNQGMLNNFIDRAIKAANLGGPPDFILVLGDFVAHDIVPSLCNPDCVKETIKYPLDKLWAARGGINNRIPIYAAVGNNDSYRGDYVISSTDGFFYDIGAIFASFALPQGSATELSQFEGNFVKNYANYTVTINQNKQLSILNTVPYANDPKLQCIGLSCAAFRQATVNFINHQTATGMPMITGMHVPYASQYANVNTATPELSTTSLFLKCSSSHPQCIQQLWAGHVHHYSQAAGISTFPGGKTLNTILAPSVTPRKGAIPGFLVAQYDRSSGKLTGIQAYSIPNYASSLANKPLSTPMVFSPPI